MSALDGLAAEDLHGLPSAELLDRTAELVRARNRIDAELARTGRAVESLPAVAAGCAAGLITAEQVAVMAKVTRPEQLAAAADQGVELAEVDGVLAETAATRQYPLLGRVVG